MAVEVKLKKWGNSMAVIVPSEIVEQRKLKENETILIEIVKEVNLSKMYGLVKNRKRTGQQAKDLVRKGWK